MTAEPPPPQQPRHASASGRTGLLRPRPITTGQFAPYGDLHEIPTDTGRIDIEPVPTAVAADMRLFVTTLGYNPTPLPTELTKLERHEWSSQLWIPIDDLTALIVVADPAPDGPRLDTAKAFVTERRIAISYHPQTWHAPMMVLHRTGRFAMAMWMNDANHTDLRPLTAPIRIEPLLR